LLAERVGACADALDAKPGKDAAATLAMLGDLVLAVNTAVAREALAIGARAGLDADTLLRLLLKGSGASAVLARWVAEGLASRDAAQDEGRLFDALRRATEAARRVDHSLFIGALGPASLRVSHAPANAPSGASAESSRAAAVTRQGTLVGVVGLGNMGRPMARRLASAGCRVVGYDVSARASDAASREGIRCTASAADLAAECEIVLIMVWDDDALRAAVLGKGGVLDAQRTPSCVIDLSTTSADVARDVGRAVAARGGQFLDGAVIGGGVAAVNAGRSPIVLSGEREAFERGAGLLAPLGDCDFVGAQGNAKAVKIINNFLVGVVTASNAEALSLGVALGVDIEHSVRALREGPATSRVLESYMGRYVESGQYGDGLIGHKLMAKDLQLAAELAESLACPAIYPRLGQQLYLAFARALDDERPFPSAFEYFRRFSQRPATGSRVRNG
jgi:3-hydroxyisobutyrate dehydrogenase-like beta-hydroxyacid dehydrogenase